MLLVVQFEITQDELIYTARVLGLVNIVERRPWSGEKMPHRRRDLRRGQAMCSVKRCWQTLVMRWGSRRSEHSWHIYKGGAATHKSAGIPIDHIASCKKMCPELQVAAAIKRLPLALVQRCMVACGGTHGKMSCEGEKYST